MIFTFLPNVIFLNLTVAILGDSYEETITSIVEKCLRDQVYLLLKYETLCLSSITTSTKECYVWIEYVEQTVDVWISHADKINQTV